MLRCSQRVTRNAVMTAWRTLTVCERSLSSQQLASWYVTGVYPGDLKLCCGVRVAGVHLKGREVIC